MINHPNPSNFFDSSAEYGSLGRAIVEISNLEFAHDRYVWEVADKYPLLAKSLSKKFPRHYVEKTDFLVNSITSLPNLRKLPFYSNGELNLQSIQYTFDELYSVRRFMVHGSIFDTYRTKDRTIWKFDRYAAVAGESRKWDVESIEASNGFMASAFWTAKIARQYVEFLLRCLQDGRDWEHFYQSDKRVREGRAKAHDMFDEFEKDGGLIDPYWKNFLSAFPRLGPVE